MIGIHTIFSADAEPLIEWVPPSDVWELNIQVDIGDEGPGADEFQFQLMSLAMFLSKLEVHGTLAPGRAVIMKRYSYGDLVATVERIIAKCESGSWERTARRLDWYFGWEFSNYDGKQ